MASTNDDLVIMVNRATYAVVALFCIGIGVYDVNAIESNDCPVDSGYLKVNEIVAPGDIGTMVHTIDTAGGAGASSQTINHDGLAFVTSTKAEDSDEILTDEARHDALQPKAINAGVTRSGDFFPSGLPHKLTASGDGPGLKQRIEYYEAKDVDLFKRSMPKEVAAGDDNVKSAIEYPNADKSIESAPRDVTTTTDYDEIGRPLHVRSSGKDGASPEEWFAYDKNGRLARHRHQQTSSSGTKSIEERYEYDILGRTTKQSIFDGATEVESTKTDYFISGANAITTILPGGGTVTRTVDALGRTTETRTNPNHPNATDIVSTVAYDREDNVVFATDGKTATASAYDSAHRLRKSISSDGTKADLTVDGLNRTRTATVTNGSATLASYGASYEGPQLKHVDDNARKHDFAWDGAGRTKSAVLTGAEQQRLSQIVYDTAGRVGETKFGEGTAAGFDHIFANTSYAFGSGNSELPVTAKSIEDGSHTQNWTLDHDTSGQQTHAGIDGSEFNFDHRFDESGNVTSSKTPARRGETTYDHDARGFTTTEQQPAAGQPNRYEPDASGALKQYTDPTGEPTKVTNDGLGRPVVREYADQTFEEIHYDGARVDFTRDRQKREQHFVYNDPAGRLTDVTSGTGVVLDHIEYENGRVVRWKTPDASIDFSDFDADNHPQQITQHRLGAGGTESDTYTITHTWNAAGELVHTGMPSYQGMSSGGRWATSIDYKYDANGNVRTILRNNAQLFDASFRGAGRPITRNLTLPNGSTLGRAYDYDDQTGSVGRLSGMHVTVGSTLVAGSVITFEGLQRKSEQLLGLAGGQRYMTFDYDDRGRVKGSLAATTDPNAIPQPGMPGASIVKLNDADFRSELDRTVAQKNDPPSTITTPTARGHKVATITKGAASETLLYRGADGQDVAVRTDDAKYHYDFDEKEHLRSITEQLIANGTQSRLIRVRYAYDGFGRIVGRRVEMAPVSNGQAPTEQAWTLATPDVVSTQPLPAATTFVWDPVTDNLLAIFPEGASRTNAAPLRQFIHGGAGMDDPIEVVTADARLFPIFDEPGAGNLQAVIGENGQLLARGLMADPYAEEQVAITAPAVDGVTLTQKPDHSVEITLHITEPLDPTTIVTGTRLAALAADATLVRTATIAPTQPDANTILWTLPAAGWTAFTADAASISIAATSSLRSITYGIQIPILPATPDMAANGNVFSTATLPIEIREPIATIQTQFTTTGTDTLFTLPTLKGLGAAASIADSLILSPFQALPFVEPMNGMVNARARFYDPRTGNFISPDPAGYGAGSADLYGFGNGDPINHRDPSGLLCEAANASGFWNWVERCSEDVLSVRSENQKNYSLKNAGKNLKRAAGGLVSTAKLAGGAARTLLWDLPTASVNDAAADRLVAAGQSIGRFASHPINTTIDAHNEMAENVLRHEQNGEYLSSGEAAASQVQTDFLAAYAAYSLGTAAYRAVPGVTIEGNPMAVDQLADTYNALSGDAAELTPTSGSAAPIVSSLFPFYRYIGEGEASYVRNYGRVPNTTFAGRPKNVSYTPQFIESSSDAELLLRMGRFNPAGPTASPVWVVEVNLAGVRLTYAGNSEVGALGIEVQTPEVVPAVRLFKLKR